MSRDQQPALAATYKARNLDSMSEVFLDLAEQADSALRLAENIQTDEHGHLLAGLLALLRQIGATADTAAIHCGAPRSASGGGLLDGAMPWVLPADLFLHVKAHAQLVADTPPSEDAAPLWTRLEPDVFRLVRADAEWAAGSHASAQAEALDNSQTQTCKGAV